MKKTDCLTIPLENHVFNSFNTETHSGWSAHNLWNSIRVTKSSTLVSQTLRNIQKKWIYRRRVVNYRRTFEANKY